MKLISHRGNIDGPNIERENEPLYIFEALEKKFDVEIDVWWKENQFWLGHDKPQYCVKKEFLQNKKLWCHAKNIEALNKMLEDKKYFLNECINNFKRQQEIVISTMGYGG